MNRKLIILASIAFILLTLMATNPSIEEHRQAVTSILIKNTTANLEKTDNNWEKLGTLMGISMAKNLVESSVSRKSYLLFSITSVSFDDKTKNIGFGILGNVWISKKVTEAFKKQ